MNLWSKSVTLPFTPAVLLAAVLFIMVSCRQEESPREVVYSCAAYTVTSDSVITPQIRVSGSDIPVMAVKEGDTVPEISFGGSTLLTRLCALGMDYLATTDTAAVDLSTSALCSIWLAGALVSPGESVARLRSMLGDDGLPWMHTGGYEWPIAGGRELWTVAAFETYCAGGDSLWLREVSDVTDRMLSSDLPLAMRPGCGLLQGSVCVPEAVTHALYPRWADAVARYESMSLSVNAIMVGALKRRQTMGEIGGISSISLETTSSGLISAINDYLWMPHRSCYTQYLYGGAWPMQSPAVDNFGQALAVLFRIPTPEMAAALLTHTPMVAGGPSLMMPSSVGTPPFSGGESWPTTQALWALAAAQSGHASALAFATAALIHDSTISGRGSASAAALAMVALRVMAGITLTADAMEFHPVILPAFDGGVHVERLPYRNAILTLDIHGSGSRIARFAIDGVETSDYRVDGALTGSHTVEITLANNRLPIVPVGAVPQTWLLPVPELDWSNQLTARIADSSPSASYHLYLNGVSDDEVSGPQLSLSRFDRLTAINLVAMSNDREGYASKTRFFVPRGALTTLQAEEFAPGGTSMVRGPRLSQRFVETSAGGLARLTLELPEPEATEALIDVCYSNGSGPAESGAACGIRRLTVNGSPCGSLIFPGRGDGWWLSTGYTNMLRASLHSGVNVIEIEADGPGAEVVTLIDYVRIFRLRKFPFPDEKNRTDK